MFSIDRPHSLSDNQKWQTVIAADGLLREGWHSMKADGFPTAQSEINLPPLCTVIPNLIWEGQPNLSWQWFLLSKLPPAAALREVSSRYPLSFFSCQLTMWMIQWWILPWVLLKDKGSVPALPHREASWKTTGAKEIQLGLDWYSCKSKRS